MAATTYQPPPSMEPLPTAACKETTHAFEVTQHIDEMRTVITSTYERILKLDSNIKITTKPADKFLTPTRT